MNAKDIIAEARRQRVKKYLDALAKLSEEHGLMIQAGFVPVEGSDFIRPVTTVEDIPGWKGPLTPEESIRAEIAPESPD